MERSWPTTEGRFSNYSRGVFDDLPLPPQRERRWGRPRQPRTLLAILGLLAVIGGGIYGTSQTTLPQPLGGTISRSTDNGLRSRGDILSPRPGDSALAAAPTEGAETPSGRGELGGAEGEGSGGEPQLGGGRRESGGSDQDDPGSGEEAEVQETQEEGKTKRLKEYLEGQRSPLADYAGVIYEEEKNAGIYDLSRLLVAISGAEQGFGKVRNAHNAWGIKCGNNHYCRYSDWTEGIQAAAKLLSDRYGLGERVTEGDIWRIAPVYAESPKWPYAVTYFWRDQE